MRHDAGYIDTTIKTVRQHKSADNPWPGWANALADAAQDERARADELQAEVKRLREALEWYADIPVGEIPYEVDMNEDPDIGKVARAALEDTP